MPTIRDTPLVGSAEAAKLLEIGPTNFSHLRKKMIDANDDNFPDPVQQLQCGPIWLEKDMLKFKKHYDARRRRVRATNGDAPVAETPAPKTSKAAKTPATKAPAAKETNGKARAPRAKSTSDKATATVTDIKPKRVLKVKQTASA